MDRLLAGTKWPCDRGGRHAGGGRFAAGHHFRNRLSRLHLPKSDRLARRLKTDLCARITQSRIIRPEPRSARTAESGRTRAVSGRCDGRASVHVLSRTGQRSPGPPLRTRSESGLRLANPSLVKIPKRGERLLQLVVLCNFLLE